MPPSAEEIKAIRKQYDLSQRCFAEMLNINYRTLQDYELGRIRPSQAATALFSIAKHEKEMFKKYIASNSRPFEK